jgi:hypothetical protein
MSGADFAREVGALTQTSIGQKPIKNKEPEEKVVRHPSDMNKFREIVNSLNVLYRASAEHKKLLVAGLKFADVDMA